jgi:exopolysaccharide production protein ExoQ
MRTAERRDALGWMLSCLSFTMLLLNQWSIRFGSGLPTVVILLFLLPWLWIILRQPSFALHKIVTNWPLFALPVLALISTLWSDYPAWSARAATQFLATTIVGVIAGSCIKPRSLLSGLLCALSLVTVLSVASGRTEAVGLTGEHALVGLFGSKNYFGLSVSFLLLTAIAVWIDRQQPRPFRWLGLATALTSPLLLVYAKSTGAMVVCLVTVLIMFLLYVGFRLLPQFRAVLMVVAVFFLIMFMIISTLNFDALQNFLGYLGKDVTLTGRTFLWEHAIRSIADNPALGVGYQAYWQPGNPGAEELWLYAGISNRYGFHFHDTYLQVAVDLGLIGLFIFVATLIAISIRIFAVVVGPKPSPEQLFAISTFLFLILRAPIEVDLFFQFQLPAILLCVIWIYLHRRARA